MPAKIILTATEGPLFGQQFVFEERTTCIIGRSAECHPCVPDDRNPPLVSRHHCLLDINPPAIRIRDFGSRNGTRVNGRLIGQRQLDPPDKENDQKNSPELDLNDGDEIGLPGTVLRIGIPVQTACCLCGAEIPEEQQATARTPTDGYRCEYCQQRSTAVERLLRLALDHNPLERYEILRKLGKGAMGEVHLARHKETGEAVALKLMLPQVAGEVRGREMFLREMENSRALAHPNIVRLLESGEEESTFFYTMEYCEGGSVADLMQARGGPLSVDEACAIVLQALQGLEYAHQAEVPVVRQKDGMMGSGRGLVHRDLKPQNLLLSGRGPEPITKIGDYGLSKAFDLAGLSGQTRTGDKAGTPDFMPRQQVLDFKYAKPEVDIWALAATLYFLLTGYSPRDLPRGKDPWQAVLQTEAVPICHRNSAIPPKLAAVIDEALIDNPTIPFKSATQFRERLIGCQES